MTAATCPHCGAERDLDENWYTCGTPTDLEFRYVECYERQIKQRDAEIERLKTASATMAGMVLKAVLDEREACAKVCESHVCTSECSAYGLGSNCEFVISAEIRARGEMK